MIFFIYYTIKKGISALLARPTAPWPESKTNLPISGKSQSSLGKPKTTIKSKKRFYIFEATLILAKLIPFSQLSIICTTSALTESRWTILKNLFLNSFSKKIVEKQLTRFSFIQNATAFLRTSVEVDPPLSRFPRICIWKKWPRMPEVSLFAKGSEQI